mmetsp:Transcript_21912/g.19456  ORF Transcript_21912/g.19456 Transcript_21912/m.19456 type:complete len:106 (+) Transcript_21912:36-353(+)
MRELETKEEYDELLTENSDKLVVIDFFAAWCGPCKIIGPKFVGMEGDFPDAIFVKVDVDENEETAEELEIEGMPTFKLFKGGEEVGSMTGANENKLRELIESHYG